MTHRRRLAALAAAALAATAAGAVALISTPAQAATNLVANPGFETGDLSGWTCDASTSAGSGHAHSGSYALAGNAAGDTAQCAQTIAVTGGAAYTLSVWVNGSYVFIGASGAVTATTWTPGTGGNYQQLTLSFTPTASGNATIYVHGWYGQGTYYADDFTLSGPGTPPSSPTPSISPSRTGSPSASPSRSTSPSPSPTRGSASPSPSPSLPPPTDGSFRHPIYFMPLDNDPQDITEAMSATGVNEFNLAFVLDSGGCTPAWDGNADQKVSADTKVAALINTVRAAGGDVAVSFGGYNGAELGASCGGASGLAAAYQQVISKYNLDRIDLDYEGDDLDANMAVRFGAIKILEDNARAAGRTLHVSLTIPMTTVGLPGSGTDEIRQAIAAGATIDLINIMAFDYGLTNAGDQVTSVKMVAQDAHDQIKSLYGWDDATTWSHMGLQLMNGHTDQPSELYTQSTFQSLLAYAQSVHVGWFSYWALNRDRACDPSVPHRWADGTCSSVSQSPWEFSKIVAQYRG